MIGAGSRAQQIATARTLPERNYAIVALLSQLLICPIDWGSIGKNPDIVRSEPNALQLDSGKETLMDQQFKDGLARRQQVMGKKFVDTAFAGADDFSTPIQESITRNVWGTFWYRDGLDLKTRSLITLSMLIAQGRSQEIKGHVRGALNNGVARSELRELLLQSAVHCGAPLALDATGSVQEILATMT